MKQHHNRQERHKREEEAQESGKEEGGRRRDQEETGSPAGACPQTTSLRLALSSLVFLPEPPRTNLFTDPAPAPAVQPGVFFLQPRRDVRTHRQRRRLPIPNFAPVRLRFFHFLPSTNVFIRFYIPLTISRLASGHTLLLRTPSKHM